MSVISEVAEGIYLIDTAGSKDSGSSDLPSSSLIYFVVGDETALIEIGPAAVLPDVLDAIHRIGYDPMQLAYTIPTHIHLDHAGGVGTLAKQIPKMQVIAHQRGAPHLIDPSKLIEGTKQAFGENFEKVHGPIVPVPDGQVHVAKEGELILLGNRELKIYEAPGHAPHHICIYDVRTKGIFSGEALGAPEIETAMVLTVAGFNLDAALETIDKLSKLDLKSVYCSNVGVCQEPSKLIESVRANTKSYGDIILNGLKEGEEREQIAQKLEEYQIARAPRTYQPGNQEWNGIIFWYSTHFRKKGLA